MQAQEALNDLMLDGYRHVAESGTWNSAWLREATGAQPEMIVQAHRALTDLQVIERDGDGWRAVSPRMAMVKLVNPIDGEVRQRAAYAENLRARLQMLLPVHDATQMSDARHTIDVVPDQVALGALIEAETARCVEELLVLRARADQSASTRNRYLDARQRGVRVRTIFQHAARYEPPTEEFVRTLGTTDMEFRTAGELPAHLLIFDRATCVVMMDSHAGAPPATREVGVAVMVRHAWVVQTMAQMFSDLWARCAPFAPTDPQPAWLGDELRRSILRLLATGVKDDAVARRLGISVRTCRRHVSDLMNDLGATSRFQAGVEAERRKLL